MLLGALVLAAAVILGFLFTARAVIFLPDPQHAEISVAGLSFNIGNNFMLLPGKHRVSARADGYFDLEEVVTVDRQGTGEVDLRLEPLPGSLSLLSVLEGVQVSIDGEPVGVAPGIIENVSRGTHIIEFSLHRYFPARQEIEVEGLGTRQELSIELQPAWGQMQFDSKPQGAELYIDDHLIGQTPLGTEVLETGSTVKLVASGYKTWEKQVSVKAGTTEAYPLVNLVVADGVLDISSSPSRATITIDDEFKGITPLEVPLSPLKAHRVELFRKGYQRAVRQVSIEPEQRSALSVSLTPIIGRIQLLIEPADAEVVVNGEVKGQGSQTLALTATEHSLTIRKPGYESHNVQVTPRPDHEQSLNISLQTVEAAYWAARPPEANSPVGSRLKLFRPDAEFMLGAPRREPGRRANEAERLVRLERPFYLGIHEVTNEEFRRWKEEHSSRAFRGQSLDMDKQPVAYVNWQEAALFCNWLSRRQGLPVFYVEEHGVVTGIDADSNGYRLPTEAEWAWAARISSQGNTLVFPWGSELYPPPAVFENYADQSAVKLLNFSLAGYNDGFAASAVVGSFQPNHNGLYDMSGNLAEWTSDYYDIRPNARDAELDPTGPESGNRYVIRGASWAMASRSELRLSYREPGSEGRMDVGFRLARYVDALGDDR